MFKQDTDNITFSTYFIFGIKMFILLKSIVHIVKYNIYTKYTIRTYKIKTIFDKKKF